MAEKRYSGYSSGFHDGSSAERVLGMCSNCERLAYEKLILQKRQSDRIASMDYEIRSRTEELREMQSNFCAKEEEWKQYLSELKWGMRLEQKYLQEDKKELQRDIDFHKFQEQELKDDIANLNKRIHQTEDSMGGTIKEQKEKIGRDRQRIKSLEMSISTWKCRFAEAEKQRDEVNQQLIQLREMVSNAFRKSRVSSEVVHPVVINDIVNHRKNVDMWLDFIRPLGMTEDCISRDHLSQADARWNVQQTIMAWLNGAGKGPKTWGTLLSAMHNGSRDLQRMANRTEYKLLEGLACLEFQLCPGCRKGFDVSSEESESTSSQPERLQLPVPVEGSVRSISPPHSLGSIATTDV